MEPACPEEWRPDDPLIIPPGLLDPLEVEAGFTVVSEYLNEELTPPDRFEFVRDGYIIQEPTNMSRTHQWILEVLPQLIRLALPRETSAQYTVALMTRYVMSGSGRRRRERIPDIAVLPYSMDTGEEFVRPHLVPLLIIEILSPSTRRIDSTLKRREYLAKGIPNYWLLSQAHDEAAGLSDSTFLHLERGEYIDRSARVRRERIVQCPEIPGFEFPTHVLWRSPKAPAPVLELRQRAEEERQRAQAAQALVAKYRAQLEELGVDPDAVER